MREFILGHLASFLIRILGFTYRYELRFQNPEDEQYFLQATKRKKVSEGKPLLIGFFHQDEICFIPFFRKKHFCVLVSHSKDGQIMTNAIESLGIHTVRGSSSRGAIAGLIAAIKKVKEGYNFALAVDGPKGPIYEVKEGICAIHKKTEFPIAPIRAHVDRAFIFEKAWNKAKLPKPFAKIIIVVGPITDYNTSSLQITLRSL